MYGLTRFINKDNHSAMIVGDLGRGTKSLDAQKPQFCEAFPEATTREGKDV